MDEILEEARWVVKILEQADEYDLSLRMGMAGTLLKDAVEAMKAAMVRAGVDPYDTKTGGPVVKRFGPPCRS